MTYRTGNELNIQLLKFYRDPIFVFSEEIFYFSKFHENEAKPDKHNPKRSLTVTSEVKNSWNYC